MTLGRSGDACFLGLVATRVKLHLENSKRFLKIIPKKITGEMIFSRRDPIDIIMNSPPVRHTYFRR